MLPFCYLHSAFYSVSLNFFLPHPLDFIPLDSDSKLLAKQFHPLNICDFDCLATDRNGAIFIKSIAYRTIFEIYSYKLAIHICILLMECLISEIDSRPNRGLSFWLLYHIFLFYSIHSEIDGVRSHLSKGE